MPNSQENVSSALPPLGELPPMGTPFDSGEESNVEFSSLHPQHKKSSSSSSNSSDDESKSDSDVDQPKAAELPVFPVAGALPTLTPLTDTLQSAIAQQQQQQTETVEEDVPLPEFKPIVIPSYDEPKMQETQIIPPAGAPIPPGATILPQIGSLPEAPPITPLSPRSSGSSFGAKKESAVFLEKCGAPQPTESPLPQFSALCEAEGEEIGCPETLNVPSFDEFPPQRILSIPEVEEPPLFAAPAPERPEIKQQKKAPKKKRAPRFIDDLKDNVNSLLEMVENLENDPSNRGFINAVQILIDNIDESTKELEEQFEK